jgi:hypothetical protein
MPDFYGSAEDVLLNTRVTTFSPSTPLNFKKQKHGIMTQGERLNSLSQFLEAVNRASLKR